MSVTLTYDPVLSRVRVTANALGAATDAIVERSLDQMRWTPVRGGLSAPASGGSLVGPVDDYEFEPGVLNYYRVRTLGAAAAAVSTGTAAHADNASVNPGLPAGHAAGQLLLVLAAIRASSGGVPNQPTGYATLVNGGSIKLFGKTHSGAESAPTVTFTGGSAGDTCSAQMAAFTNAAASATASAVQFNSSGQNIAFPALDPLLDRQLILWLGQRYDDWTSVDTLPGATEIGDPSSSLGFDQGIVWDYLVQQDRAVLNAGSFVVNGGSSSPSLGVVAAIAPASVTSQTNSITPVLDEVWLKFPLRPNLNRPIQVVRAPVETARAFRGGLFQVIGRSAPIAVTDVRGPRRESYDVLADGADAIDLEHVLLAGEPVYLHTPAAFRRRSMHAVVGDVSIRQASDLEDLWLLNLPLTQVAAPDATVVGSTATCATVLATYATCADVVLAHPTCADVLELIGSPTEIIVP